MNLIGNGNEDWIENSNYWRVASDVAEVVMVEVSDRTLCSLFNNGKISNV